MAEVAVFRIGGIERVGRLVVRTVPRQREIDVLGDVAAQHGAEVVSHIARVVALAARNHSRRRIHRTAQHARGLAVNDARHDVEVRLEEPDREAVAQVGHQAPAAVEIDRHGIEVGRITLTVYFDRGILHRMRGDVIRRALEREHPHERPALLDVRIDVVEIDAVRVEGFEPRITVRNVLCIRYVVDALQVGHLRIVRIGRDEQPQRVLTIDVELAHHEVGHVVVVVADLLRTVLRHHAVEQRALVVNVRDERVALLRIAESRTEAMRGEVALVGVRQLRIGRQSGDREVAARFVGALVALLMVVGGAVLEAHLRVFGHRFRVGELAAQGMAARRRHIAQVAQLHVIVRNPYAGRGIGDRAVGKAAQLVGVGSGVVLAVRIAETAVERDRPAVLAQFGAVNGECPEAVSAAEAVVEVVRAAVSARRTASPASYSTDRWTGS